MHTTRQPVSSWKDGASNRLDGLDVRICNNPPVSDVWAGAHPAKPESLYAVV